jgi:serine/threonine protein kinase
MTNSMMAGTPHYMAPEMATDEKLTHLVDIYALGVFDLQDDLRALPV